MESSRYPKSSVQTDMAFDQNESEEAKLEKHIGPGRPLMVS